mmetsp:Transcript_148929/g.263049  ORF Transcript_148929/g.263049 Transcript_148929/m.263049 type:complete len:310 (-) Transcript_148929:37-966(-)
MAADPVKPQAVAQILSGIENAANQAVRSTDPKVVPKAEKDLLRQLEALRAAMDKVMQQLNVDDATQLNECFGGDCLYAGRCRAVLETLTFEDRSPGSNSVKGCLAGLEAVERALEATGCSDALRAAQERERKAFLDRAVAQDVGEDYADSEDAGSENWDDESEALQGAMPNFAVPVPEALEGWLLKKSPQPRLFKQFQKRWIVLEAGRLSWFGSDSDAASGQAKLKGQIDFAINPCVVCALNGSDTQFALGPAGGQWVLGSFTGAAEGREFNFDAAESDYDRDSWIESINAHIKHAKQSFQGAARAFAG